MHPILVLLAVIVGGGLAGIVGVIVAVPLLAVLRILFDFFRVRLKGENELGHPGAAGLQTLALAERTLRSSSGMA